MKKVLVFGLTYLVLISAKAQNCSQSGMTPATAIPVCGELVFRQNIVVNCSGPRVAHNTSCTAVTSDNAFWYKFRCYTAGRLGFLIKGISTTDDFDWILYDVTGKSPNAVFTDATAMISMNIYGVSTANPPFPNSPTGAIPSGTGNVHCEGDAAGNTPFNEMPNLIVGHDYLLMVSNYSASGNGYDLEFTGGNADITDPNKPAILTAEAICDGEGATIKFNKIIKCSSLTSTGSEFSISPAITTVRSARGVGCSTGSDFFEEVRLTFNSQIPPGSYTIRINRGTDGNTLFDVCNNELLPGSTTGITLVPQFPTPMDSIEAPLICERQEVDLVFSKFMKCNSVAPNGSDFIVSGPAPIAVASAEGICDSFGLAQKIRVKFASPLVVRGIYTITLVRGSDGNTIINECGQESIPLQRLNFISKDTVNANFTSFITRSCITDTFNYRHDGRNEVSYWRWTFDDVKKDTLQNPYVVYTDSGFAVARLIVGNGTCFDTSQRIVNPIPARAKANFNVTPVVCPGDLAGIANTSTGSITRYEWEFGNGRFSALKDPTPVSYLPGNPVRDYSIRLLIEDDRTCVYTVRKSIIVPNNCNVLVPTAFTPNGDGLNEFLYPLNAYAVSNLVFKVFNRVGQVVFETTTPFAKWNGMQKGQPADTGGYVWFLQYTDSRTSQSFFRKGSTMLIR